MPSGVPGDVFGRDNFGRIDRSPRDFFGSRCERAFRFIRRHCENAVSTEHTQRNLEDQNKATASLAMTGLPPNWEWDYDGQRWFYKYKPTGHIQFHFPSEGDEFPDFVQAGEPAPNLAPEERLASQQQVKRQTGTAGPNEHTRKAGGEQIAKTLGMSATAKPVSTVWEGDDEEEAVFQPENFMFLGPGTYADVSPLYEEKEEEEEEQATKRAVTGGTGEREKGTSPLGSGKTTPMMGKSEISSSTTPATNAFKAAAAIDATVDTEHSPSIESHTTSGDNTVANMIESEPVVSQPVEADLASMLAEDPGTQAFHILDSRDMPVETLADTAHRFDPVGFVAEMPTEHTGVEHIELHPDPIEIADNSILAPIETMQCTNMVLAELPEKNSPVDGKGKKICIFKTPEESRSTARAGKTTEAMTLQTVDTKQGQKTSAAGELTDVRNHHTQSPRTNGEQSSQPAPKLETYKITRKQPGSTPGTPIQSQSQSQSTCQAHVPGHPSTSQAATPDKRYSVSPQREAPLTLNPRRESISMNLSTVPKVPLPTHDPSKSVQTTAVQSETEQRRKERERDWGAGLARVPSSVLKPARNQRHPVQSPPQQSQQQHQQEQQQVPWSGSPAGSEGSSQAMNQLPSVLRPARGRTESQPWPDGLPNQQNSGSSAARQNIVTATQPGPDRSHVSRPKTQPNAIVPGSSDNCQSPPQSWQGQTLPKRRDSAMPTLAQKQSTRPLSAVGGTISSGPASAALASSSRPFDQTSKEGPLLILEFQVPQSQNVHNMAAGQPQLRRSTAPMVTANASPLQNAQDVAVGQPRLQQAPSIDHPVAPAVALPNPQGEQQSATTSSFNVLPLRNIQNAERQQFGPAEPMQPGIRRASAFTPEDATARSRADSQVSSISHTPADSYMLRSSNPLVDGPNYAPQPLTDNNAGSDALNQPPPAQPSSGAMPPDQMQGQMPSVPVPQGPPQGQWNPQWNPRVTHAQPPQELQGGKGKEKKWTRWFKGGSSKSKAPQQAQMMPPRPGPQQWAAGGPFSPAHIWQPGQQGPAGMASQGQGQCPSIVDSTSISTLGSDRKSRHGQQLPAGQSTMPGPQNLVPGGGQEQAPGQPPPPGQTLQGQMYARRMPQMPSENIRQAQAHLQITQGAAGRDQTSPGQPSQSQFLPGQMHPSHLTHAQSTGQGPTAQMSSQGSPAQVPPGQTYFGQMHPLSMPLNSPSQGHTTTQPGLRHQGQGIRGAASSGQLPMGNSKTASASGAGDSAPLQNQPPQQHPQQQSKEKNLKPAPLFAVASGSRPASTQAPGHQVAANEKGAHNPIIQQQTILGSIGEVGRIGAVVES